MVLRLEFPTLMPTSSRTLSPRNTLIVLTGLNLLNYIDRYILSAILSPIKEEMNLSDGELGRISTAFMLGYFISSPFFGYLGDRYSRKWLIALGIFVWSLGTVLSGFATGLGLLLIFRLLVGFGEASYATLSPGWIADVYPESKRNNAITLFYTAIPIGAALGYIFGGVVSTHFGWRSALIWAGAPGLFLALLLLPFREPQRACSANPQPEKGKVAWGEVLSILKIKNFNYACWGYTAYTFAMGAFAHWTPTFLTRNFNVPLEKASTYMGGVIIVAGFVGTLSGGYLATHLKKKYTGAYAWVSGISCLLAAPCTWIAFQSNHFEVSLGLYACAMILLFVSTGPINTLLLEVVPANLRSSSMALALFITHMFGDMWSPEIIGHAADSWNNLGKALCILPIFLLLAGALWTKLGRLLTA